MTGKHDAPALIMVSPVQSQGVTSGAIGTWCEFSDDQWRRAYVPAPAIAGLPDWGRIGNVIEVGTVAKLRWEIRGMVDDQVIMRRRSSRYRGGWEYITAGPDWFARFDEINVVSKG